MNHSSAKSSAEDPGSRTSATDDCDAGSSESGEPISVGVFVARGPSGDEAALEEFARRAIEPVRAALAEATGRVWRFHMEEPHRLPDDEPRPPSDLVDEAALRMVSGPYDVIVAVTNVGLSSRRRRLEPGLASPVARVVTLSTRSLRRTPRGERRRGLDDPAVVTNASALLLRLMGRILGLRTEPDGAMAPFRFDGNRDGVPPFSPDNRRRLERAARTIPEREQRNPGRLHDLAFYLTSFAHHMPEVLRSLWRNRAPLLPLSLPALSTAAIAPALVLIFSAETWDVGLHITTGISVLSGVASIVAATLFLVFSHGLHFPRREKRLLTEHLAVVNITVTASIFLATIGLFVMLGLLMLAIELMVFPPDLISEWPSLEDPAVTTADFLRLAAFVSTLGVISGALGGGLDSRTVIQHLALFLDEP